MNACIVIPSLGPAQPLDLTFVFDGSDSLTEEEFENVKQFATSVVESYNISPLETRVAVVEYSNRPRIVSRLVDGDSPSEVIKMIQNIAPSRGINSVMSEALEEAARNVFSPQAGARIGVPKSLILVTHSQSSSSVPVSQATQRLRAAGVRVYVVGLGSRVNMQEIKSIAAGDSALYPVQTPDEVPGIANDVVRSINQDIERSKCQTNMECSRQSEVLINTVVLNFHPMINQCKISSSKICANSFTFICVTENAESQLDVTFIVGASEPRAGQLFKFELNIVKMLIDLKSPVKTRYSLITYGKQAYVRMSFGDFQEKSRMKQFLDLIQWSENAVALNDALQKAQKLFQESSPLNSRKLLVLFITSRTGVSITELKEITRKLRENKVNILVIPIDDNVDDREISGITKRRDDVIPVTRSGGARAVIERTEGFIATDPCSAVDCDYYGVCIADEQGSTSCVCKMTYLDTYKPVCGSDLKTYSNLEAMKIASCKERKMVTQKSPGECSKLFLVLFVAKITVLLIKSLFFAFHVDYRKLKVTDLAFALDGSRKLTGEEFNRLKSFVKTVIQNYEISEPGTHVAVIEYSDAARVAISFKDTSDLDSFKKAIDQVRPSRGTTASVNEALKLAREELFSPIGGGRPGIAKVKNYLTDRLS